MAKDDEIPMRHHRAERAGRGLLRRRAKRNEETGERDKLRKYYQRAALEAALCRDLTVPLLFGDDPPLEAVSEVWPQWSASASPRACNICVPRGNVTEVMRGAGMRLEGGFARKAVARRGHLE